MAENEPLGSEISGGALTQEALDALLAAATAEVAEKDDALDPEAWARELAESTEEESLGGEVSAEVASSSRTQTVVDLPSFDTPAAPSAASGGSSMTRVRDIPLEVTVELGRTRLLIRDILDLGTGSIIELDKIAGEPVDLFANGLLVARGEVIVIDDNFGVRVTEIITAADRNQMKEADTIAA